MTKIGEFSSPLHGFSVLVLTLHVFKREPPLNLKNFYSSWDVFWTRNFLLPLKSQHIGSYYFRLCMQLAWSVCMSNAKLHVLSVQAGCSALRILGVLWQIRTMDWVWASVFVLLCWIHSPESPFSIWFKVGYSCFAIYLCGSNYLLDVGMFITTCPSYRIRQWACSHLNQLFRGSFLFLVSRVRDPLSPHTSVYLLLTPYLE